jgi:soluble lytic murein transglycosylase-like protein
MQSTSRAALAVLLLMSAVTASAQACWDDASRRSGIPAELLYAIARVESNLNPLATNRNHEAQTGSRDIGLMQINSSHLGRLARSGIRESDLLEPCTNLQVGAWLLADTLSRHGPSWEAIGAYNAACSRLKGDACRQARSQYAWRVYKHLPAPPTDGMPPAVAAPDIEPTRSVEPASMHVSLKVAP